MLENSTLVGGQASNLRGETSEVALHNSIKNYINHKNKLMGEGHSENKAHEAALEHLKSDSHYKTLVSQTKKYQSKKIQIHSNDHPDDFNHTVRDSAHAASDYISHIVKKHGHLTGEDPTLTGPEGEVKTAKKVGITNADILIRARGKKRVSKKIQTKKGEARIHVNIQVPRFRGNSLKYEDGASSATKVRTSGEAMFHNAVHTLARSVFGPDHHHTKTLETLRSNQTNAAKGTKNIWQSHPDYEKVNAFTKQHGYSHTDSLDKLQSNLRKISRKHQDSDPTIYNTALDHLATTKSVESGSKGTKAEYMNHVANVLNSAYQNHKDEKTNRAINQFHRQISGVYHRKRKWSKIKAQGGEELKAKVIPTIMMKISRSKKEDGKFVPPKTKILSLRDRFERISKHPDKFNATSTGGGGLTISKGDRGFLRISSDTSGTMVSYLQSKVKNK